MRRQLASRQDRGLAVPFHLALVNSDQLVTPHSEQHGRVPISRRNSGRAMIGSIVRGLSRRFNAELLKVTMEVVRVSSLLGRRH